MATAELVQGAALQVVPGLLFLGDLDHAKGEAQLRELGVTHIVTALTSELPSREGTFTRLFLNLSGRCTTTYIPCPQQKTSCILNEAPGCSPSDLVGIDPGFNSATC